MTDDRIQGLDGAGAARSLLSLIAAMTCFLLLGSGCSDQTQIQRTLSVVGPEKLRNQALEACHNTFPRTDAIKIAETSWPPAVRAFRPLSVWAEPDGVYLLLDSDAGGERGLFLPRVVSEQDPTCGPKLKHVKLAPGVYWYDRAR